MDLFRVRLNNIDHYQASPTCYDPQLRNDVRPSQGAKGPKVPVIRIFGSTETGQKVCAHVHGAFPYLYVEYDGDLASEEVGTFAYRLHLSIDHALAVSYRRDQHGENATFVARITLVKGVPFYGFHVGYRFFLKIYMLNPLVMTRLADLLQQGVIMKRKFQPHEAHLQFLLQFMIDYNLYGCDYLDSCSTMFRAPIPEYGLGSNSSHLWHSRSVPLANITDDLKLPRVSHCSIEVDISVQDIMNRRTITERRLHHDFIERISPLPKDIKLVSSMAGLWTDETKRRQRQMASRSLGASPFPPEVLVSMSADPRQTQPQHWLHEEDFREQIQQLIEDERPGLGNQDLSFENFASRKPGEDAVKTALQSIEDLHPSHLMSALGLSADQSQAMLDLASSIDVDDRKARMIRGEEDDYPYDSDEELAQVLDEVEEEASAQANQEILQVPGGKTKTAQKHRSPRRSTDVIGLQQSFFQTGRLPRFLSKHALVEISDQEDLYGRAARPLAAPISTDGSRPKRRSSSQVLQDRTFKRAKLPSSATPPTISEIPVSLAPLSQESTINQQSPNVPIPSHTSNSTDTPEKSNLTSNVGSSRGSQGINSTTSEILGVSKVSQLTSPSEQRPLLSADPARPMSIRPLHTQEDASQKSRPSSLRGKILRYPSLSRGLTDSRLSQKTLVFCGVPPPPSFRDQTGLDAYHQDPFYSEEKDVPTRSREYAGREFRLEARSLPFLPTFDSEGLFEESSIWRPDPGTINDEMLRQFTVQQRECSWASWEPALPPPTFHEVQKWWTLRQEEGQRRTLANRTFEPTQKRILSQIEGPTCKSKHGFKYTQKNKTTSVSHEIQYMSTLSLEVHVNTRGKFVPNPEEDEVQCVFWALKSDESSLDSQNRSESIKSGIVLLCNDEEYLQGFQSLSNSSVIAESTELDLFVRMVEIVRTHDPDVLTGYEVHGTSWGFLIERARYKYEYNLCDEFSRMRTESQGRFGKENDRWGFTTTSTIKVTGRHMINIWRAMRGELNLLQYTMENVVWHLLHRRIPHYPWRTLTNCFMSGKLRDLARLIKYYEVRTRLDIEILEANELISRTSEQARLLGVDFFSVFSRGSQYKVESIMFRIAKPENFILVSPNRRQVGGQNALECLPLVMEPQSAFYSSPLLVLDFQSLYPSVMIAYNYCYSTFLGRITNWRGTNKMGFTEYKRQQGLLNLLRDYINIAPNGMMYAKVGIRKSLLAKMLTEILETRVMVKSGMKQDKDDKTLQKLLNNRQLALKLLANVTYGYTSASFSGRMPCSEIADSIVQTGRETLERAIAYIQSVERWGAEVVYGDTDSLFVYLKGKTRDQAFTIGNEMVQAITKMNPQPIKLKFEKVYHPCVLLAKKRYVGYKYEYKDQVKPDFDAKGIETVRRDGTPAEQKIEEKALRMLFETADLSQIKSYFQRQCEKIMRGTVSVQDFCFAKEVRLGTYSDKGPPPAGALISTKRMLEDARAEPQYGERVPYVVITGAPGARLIDRCVAPEELLSNPHWQLDADYYISKNLIPPLERIFNLTGANVRQWYDEMPKIQRTHQAAAVGRKKVTLESYMKSSHCLVCRRRYHHQEANDSPLCRACQGRGPASLLHLQTKLRDEERRYEEVLGVCRSCSGIAPLEEVTCDSKDCPVFWTRMRQLSKVDGERAVTLPAIRGLLEGLDRSALEW